MQGKLALRFWPGEGLVLPVIFERIAFWIVLALAAYASNYRSFVFSRLHPFNRAFPDQLWTELSYWLLASLLVLWLLIRDGNLGTYCRNWRRQHFLLAFLTICCGSLIWSADQAATLFRSCVLIGSTGIAAYIGMRCKPEELLRYLSWFSAAVAVASAYMVATDPLWGIDRHYGPSVWRGIFWNKNHLGSVAALCSALLLLRIVDIKSSASKTTRFLLTLIYIAVLVVVYESRSGTGGLVALILHALVFLATLWTIFESRMRKAHYVFVVVGGVLVIAVALANLELIFGLFNKDFTLSGRIVLWRYLLQDVVANHPVLGQGFGALWGDPNFRAQAAVPLGMVPVIADNGFIDILLGVGVLGFACFMLVYLAAWVGAFQYFVREKRVACCMPLVVMSSSLFSNLGFSLLTEIEVLFWGLIVAVLFATSRHVVPLLAKGES